MKALLCNRSGYSLLKSTIRIDALLQYAKQQQFDAIGLMDFQNMHGIMAFYHACIKTSIKPLVGLEITVDMQGKPMQFYLFAKDNIGYQQLIFLSCSMCCDQSVLSYESWITHCDHCKVIVPMDHSLFNQPWSTENTQKIREWLIDIQQHGIEIAGASGNPRSQYEQAIYTQALTIFEELKIPSIIASLATHITEQEQEAYKALVALSQDVSINSSKLVVQPHMHALSAQEYNNFDSKLQENTKRFVQDMDIDCLVNQASLPAFEVPNELSNDEYLKQLCVVGLQKRMGLRAVDDVYKKRLFYELDIISNMHFSDYFLIVWDYIRFARKKGIYVGPGRGSAAGSLVAYCLGITHLDPIRYHLLFERFLNPERISMPDIDVDFPDNRREEVIEYVCQKYGTTHVGHIITFGTFGAKQVLRDLARVYQLNPSMADTLAKCIPQGSKTTLEQAYNTNRRFRELIHSSKQLQDIYQTALQLEGLPRHRSLHAAGIVMSNQCLSSTIPMIRLDDDTLATQFTMEYLESVGLIKMDFLGIRNLTTIDEIIQDIKPIQNINILQIPLDDKPTYQLISQADTVGIFQLESDGMKDLLRKMKPKTFEDVAVTIALYRPGPMENIPMFLEHRSNPSSISYLHPVLESILKETYGIIVYQEQIMQISQVMAGFSLGKADILRKAMSKKKESELIRLKDDFIQGCLLKHYSTKIANDVYDLILKFANYGFNKSHSMAYALVAYQMAYLKANFPLFFYRSLLNSVIGKEDKTNEYIRECKRKGIAILPPCVNRSQKEYIIEAQSIRMPLNSIKTIGNIVSDSIIDERKEHGSYQDVFDFILRIQERKVSRSIIERLIDAGSLDIFHFPRTAIKASLDKIIQYGQLVRCEVHGQVTFDFQLVAKPHILNYVDNQKEIIECQKEALGFYLYGHPLEQIRKQHQIQVSPLKDQLLPNANIKAFIVIQQLREIRTKKGELMCFFTANDESCEYEFTIMPNLYHTVKKALKKGSYVLIGGVVQIERNSCLVRSIDIYQG